MSKLFESHAEEITRLILVRHGRTQNNVEARIGARDDSELNETGLDQAHRVAERLLDFPVTHIYSSPVKRAHQTAEIIAEKLTQRVKIRPELTEYHFGVISGLSMDEVNQQYPDIYTDLQNWMHLPVGQHRERTFIPEAESFFDLEKRTLAFFDFVKENHLGETIIAVSHLGIIKCFMATLFGSSVHNHMNYIAFNTSLTVIDFLRGRAILMAFNDCRHLDQGLPYGKITPF